MIEVLKKIYKSGRIKQIFLNRLVLFTALFILVQPKTKKSLELLQLSIDQKVLRKLRKKSQSKIVFFQQRFEDFIENFEDLSDVIWIFWLQGIENAPELVKICHEYLKENLPAGKRIILLDEDNYKNYTNLPEYIEEKHREGKISHTHFSDIIRMDLLARHGGTWMDSTVLLSAVPTHNFMFESSLFLFQEMEPSKMGHSRRISSWFITSNPNNPIILLTRYLLFDYWKNHGSLIDYFLLHSYLELAIESYPEEWNKVVPFNNATPHILQFKLFKDYQDIEWTRIKEQVEIHKLTYKFKEEIKPNTYIDRILNKSLD